MKRKSWWMAGLLVTCLGVQAAPPGGCPFLDEEIQLSEEQQVQIQQVMQAHRQKMMQLHQQMRQQVETVLTDEQKALIEESDWAMGPMGRGRQLDENGQPVRPAMGMFRSGKGCWWMGGQKEQAAEQE